MALLFAFLILQTLIQCILFFRDEAPLWQAALFSLFTAACFSVFWFFVIRPYRRIQMTMERILEGHVLPDRALFGEALLTPTMEMEIKQLEQMLKSPEMMDLNKRQAQYLALQNQINPHFLYNTLNCILGLIDLGRTQDCKKAITALADIERMSLKGEPFCTLEKDLSYIRQYTFIQQLRFENKLQFLIDIPADLQKFIIPKLVLQPLIENAVLHGTSAVNRKGIIGVFARTKQESLLISIKDNGPGFMPEFIRDFAGHGADRPQNSYGLYNIDRCLKLYFGENYGLTLSNNPSAGACVTIQIPCCTREELDKKNSKILYRKGTFDHEDIDC